jgi:hypothetical protein
VEILGTSYIGKPPQGLHHLQPQYADYLASRPIPEAYRQQGHGHAPEGGYSDYDYAQQSGSGYQQQQQQQQQQQHHHHYYGTQSQNPDYAIHKQAYRPTEEEAAHSHAKPSSGGQRAGKLEAGAQKLENSVNNFFKKLEKRLA